MRPRPQRSRLPRARQRGVALITVLLIVALAATAAASMTGRHQFDVRRTSNRLALAQAHQVALGGEAWARGLLARDRRGEARGAEQDQQAGETSAGGQEAGDSRNRPVEVDGLDENWAQDLPPIPIEGGQVTGNIVDLQGRFNINNLVDGGTVDAVAVARFERLLAQFEIEAEVVQAVVDWLDTNREPGFPGGAEDNYYLTRDQPYLTANRLSVTASELRLVRGIDAEAWRRLAPHVVALPTTTGINVNTASPEVLRTVLPDIDEAAAEQLAETAAEQPFLSISSFRGHSLVPRGSSEAGNERLVVASRYFRVRTDVLLGPIEYTLYSWLARNDNGASRVLRRGRTPH